MKTERITDQEIESCGWSPQVVRVDKQILDEISEGAIETDGDILLDGWGITINDKEWYEMCRNSRRLTIVHKWYRNKVGQEWDVVMDASISNAKELLNEMSYLGITKKIKDGK